MSLSKPALVLAGAACLAVVSACVQLASPGTNSTLTPDAPTVAPTVLATLAPTVAPTVASASSSLPPISTPTTVPSSNAFTLVPDPDADYTTGDTARLSGGEFVGDQADLAVIEAMSVLTADAAQRQYSFLVEITGLDPDTFPYNLRDFRLIDDQAFQYEPLYDGGQAPRLEFGDLAPEQTVRGWLTFEGPAETATVELQYSPALALESALFGFLVP